MGGGAGQAPGPEEEEGLALPQQLQEPRSRCPKTDTAIRGGWGAPSLRSAPPPRCACTQRVHPPSRLQSPPKGAPHLARTQGFYLSTPPGLSSCSPRHPGIRPIGMWGRTGAPRPQCARSPRWPCHPPQRLGSPGSHLGIRCRGAQSSLCSAPGESLAPPRPRFPQMCWEKVGQLTPKPLPAEIMWILGVSRVLLGLPMLTLPPSPQGVLGGDPPSPPQRSPRDRLLPMPQSPTPGPLFQEGFLLTPP